MTNDSDHICVTCGKSGGACRWVDDAAGCMRQQLVAARTKIATLTAALAKCDAALGEMLIWNAPTDETINSAAHDPYVKAVVAAREARRAAKEAAGG